MKNIEIVEFERKYAASLADMWNRSADNWGGYDSVITEEEEIRINENSGNLHTFLALDKQKNEIVGFCSMSIYQEDKEALYIPLLNVRPDYHGQKIGKALVLKVVQKTIEKGWPRLDLYTWPGNTKAVPLYKKCGFFWEKRDDSTHLMNFIPYVMKTEAVVDYFKFFDWYNDSQREIKIVPDGSPEDDHCFYNYSWQKEGKQLKMGFERRGRGLRMIKTDDYLITMELEDREPVFGNLYQVTFHVENLSGKKLDIKIKGRDDASIKYSQEYSGQINNKQKITGTYFVDQIKNQQNKWRTHPAVTAEVFINGKKALFKTGVLINFPLKLSLKIPEDNSYLMANTCCYLELENGFAQEKEFEIEIPKREEINFSSNNFTVKLAGEQKKSIPLQIKIKKFFFYNQPVKITVDPGQEEFVFNKNIQAEFKGSGAIFAGKKEKGWILCNNKYSVFLNKYNNEISIDKNNNLSLLYPRLGRPFSLEFSSREAASVKTAVKDNKVQLIAEYISGDFSNISISSVITLFADGMIKQHYLLKNRGKENIQDLYLKQPVYFNLADSSFPYGEKIMKIEGQHGANLEYWNNDQLDENWFFAKNKNSSRALIFPQGADIIFNEWHLSCDFHFSELKTDRVYQTEDLIIAINIFENHRQTRKYALQNYQVEKREVISPLQIKINEGNPFVREAYSFTLKDNKRSSEQVTPEVESRQCKTKIKKDSENQLKLIPVKAGLDYLDIKIVSQSAIINNERAVFNYDHSLIKKEIIEQKGQKVLKVGNSSLEFKACDSFAPALFSLHYKGLEWLQSSFPQTEAFSWWNPWSGGIYCHPGNMSLHTLLEEQSTVSFADLEDTLGNKWSGIKIVTEIKKHETYRCLTIEQYFLTLPGLPVLCNPVIIKQQTGFYFKNVGFSRNVFLKTAEKLTDSWFKIYKNDQQYMYRAGRVHQSENTDAPVLFGSDERQAALLIYPAKGKQTAYTEKELLVSSMNNHVSATSGSTEIIAPLFLIFAQDYLAKDFFNDLKNINFKPVK